MTSFGGMQLALLILSFLLIIPLLGNYMALVFEGFPPFFCRPLEKLERFIYRFCGVDQAQEMTWKEYAKALLLFNLIGLVFLFCLQLAQGFLPLNPQHFPGLPWSSALNTAISFVTNTDWQVYSGETTMSYLTQMLGLTVQNFTSAATGFAVLLTLIRGIKRQNSSLIGNFWVDFVRAVVYLLLPLSVLLSIALISQGVIQNFHPYQTITTWERETQILPMGPVASQEAIKQLGTNGGGFFNANSAHPFENPSPLSNLLELIAILAIPASLPYMYGLVVGAKRQGLVLLWTMIILWGLGLAAALYFEWAPNSVLEFNPVIEGKEMRMGVTNSVLWAATTTSTSNGSINAMHDSLSPLTGGVILLQMMLDEVVFGGIGTGLSSMLMYVLLTVFFAGLMVGRTPEYMGKKIEKAEIQWVVIAILAPAALILVGSTISLVTPQGLAGLNNKGPHGLSEILYAFTSTAEGNGSAFAGLNTDTPFYHLLLGAIMLLGRLSVLIPALAIAGSFAKKKIMAVSPGTFKTHTVLFGVLLMSVILILTGLTFFPALALGPIVEHLLLQQGQAF